MNLLAGQNEIGDFEVYVREPGKPFERRTQTTHDVALQSVATSPRLRCKISLAVLVVPVVPVVLVPRSLVENQCTMVRPQAGQPMPCTQPLRNSRVNMIATLLVAQD